MDIFKNTNRPSDLLMQAFVSPNESDKNAMFESNSDKPPAAKKALSDAIFEAVIQKNKADERSVAAAAVLGWAQGSSPNSEGFDGLALVLAGISEEDDDDDLSDDQIDEYNRQLGLLADAAVSLGADQDSVTQMIDEDDDDSAVDVADGITANSDDDDQSIAVYGVSGNDDAMLEANIRVVRNGEWKLKKKRPRPRRINASQRAALKKARTKAHTASANLSRRKSLKLRRQRGV